MKYHWRVDAKWVVGIFCVLCVTAASITYSLHRITALEPASGASAAVIDTMAEEMVDNQMFTEMQAAAKASPKAEVQVNGLRLPLTGKEITGLTKKQTLKKASTRLADIIYFGGVEAGDAYFQEPKSKEGAGSSAKQSSADGEGDSLSLEPLTLFTQETHDGLHPFVLGLSLVAAMLLATIVLLSRGLGRVGSPGVALVAGIGPATLSVMVLRTTFADARDEGEGMLPGAAEALYSTVDDVSRLFTIIAVIGAVLITAAIIGHVASIMWLRGQPQTAAPSEEEPPAAEPEEQPEPAEDEGDAAADADGVPYIRPSGVPQR